MKNLTPKPDIDHLDTTGVVFTDGTREEIDEVVLATGYHYLLPFLEDSLLPWRGGRPELYLNIFARGVDTLYVLGFIEFADAAYKRFDEMASLIVGDIRSRETGTDRATWMHLKRADRPDLRGGIAYIDTPRHTNYVHSETYQQYLADLAARLGVPPVTHDTFPPLHDGDATQVEAGQVEPAQIEPG